MLGHSSGTVETADRPSVDVRRRRRHALVVGAALALGTLTLALFRIALATNRTGPIVIADEIGYLVNARVLTGGQPATMSSANVYSGGYSFILAPAFLVGGTPADTYSLVLTTNALLGAAVLPLTYGLLTRGIGVGPVAAYAGGMVAALYPPFVGISQLAISENLIVPLLGCWLVLLVEGCRRRRVWLRVALVVAAGVAAGWLATTHGRMLPVVLIHVAALVVLGARRRIPAVAAGAGAVSAVVATLVLLRASDALVDANWPVKTFDQRSSVFATLRDLSVLPDRARFGVGQIAYLGLATFGLAVVGLVILVGLAAGAGSSESLRARLAAGWARPAAPAHDPCGPMPVRHTAVVVGWIIPAAVAGVLVATSLAAGTFDRPDHAVYGRYVEVFAPMLIAVAVMGVTRRVHAGASPILACGISALITVTATVATLVLAEDLFEATNIGWANVLGLLAIGPAGALDPALSLARSMVVLAGVAIASMFRRAAVVAIPIALIGLSLYGAVALDRRYFDPREAGFYPTAETIDRAGVIEPGATVAYDTSASSPSEWIYQFYLDTSPFVLFDGRVEAPPATAQVLVAPQSWEPPPELDVRRRWVDPVFGVVIWDVAPEP